MVKKFLSFYGTRKRLPLVPNLTRPIKKQSMPFPSQFLKIHFQLSYYLHPGLPSGPLTRPYPQEVETLLLKHAQFAFIFCIPLSYALQRPHSGLASRENVLHFRQE
jgi:hypothetical protein